MRFVFLSSILFVSTCMFACGMGEGGETEGILGGPCFVDGSCNEGLTCNADEVCVQASTDPSEMAVAVSFVDMDGDLGELSGDIVITPATDETSITHYRIYWTNAAGGIVGLAMAEFAKTGGELVHTVPANTPLPEGVSRLLVLTRNSVGEMDIGVSVLIVDSDDIPPTVSFPFGVQVSGSGVSDVNGWYFEDGEQDGYPKYKHEMNDVWIFWESYVQAWVIWQNTSPDDFYASYHYDEETYPYSFAETGWDNGTFGFGDITVIHHRALTGVRYVGQEITAHYNYADAEGDLEGDTKFTWYRCNDPADPGVVVGGSSQTHPIISHDVNKFIRVEVTPVALTGSLTGAPVKSEMVFGPVHPFESIAVIGEFETQGGQIRYSPLDDLSYLSWVDTETRDIQTGSYDGELVDLGFIDEGQHSDGKPLMALGRDGKPVIAFRNSTDGSRASVYRYDGSLWSDLGNADLAIYGGQTSFPRVEVGPDDVPVVIYRGTSPTSPLVSKHDGGSRWADLGVVAESPGGNYSMAIGSDSLPIVTVTSPGTGPTYIKKYNGSTWDSWPVPFTSMSSMLTVVDTDKQRPTIACVDNGRAWVFRWEDEQWADLGSPLTDTADHMAEMVYDQDNTLYLVLVDGGWLDMYRYEGLAQWTYMGAIGHNAWQISLTFDASGRAQVLYKDPEQAEKLHFLQFHQ